jgi:hypothetical protein
MHGKFTMFRRDVDKLQPTDAPLGNMSFLRLCASIRAAALAAAFLPSVALALPSLTPHDDTTAGNITWQNPVVGFNPNIDAHQHWKNQNLFNTPRLFKTYAAWDNTQYRYNAATDKSQLRANGDAADYGHGFMDPTTPALYYFRTNGVAGVSDAPTPPPGHVTPMVDFFNTVGSWMNLVNQTGNLNSNGKPTQSSIQFLQGGAGANTNNFVLPGFQLEIRFDTRYLSGPAGGGVTNAFPTESEIGPLGDWGGNPNGGAAAGVDGTLAYWSPARRILTFNRNVNWYFSDGTLNDTDNTVAPGQFDFMSVAFHEFGHVLGLDHPDYGTNVAPNQVESNTTMFPKIPRRGGVTIGGITYDGIRRGIDGDTIDGARGLYTIPVPEPETWGLVLLSLGFIGLGLRRKLSTI